MRIERNDREIALRPGPDGHASDQPQAGRRERRPRRLGGMITTLAVLAIIAGAAVWAWYANVKSTRPTMDMTMRVSSGGTPFPVTLAAAERSAMRGTVVYTGSVAAFSEEEIFPRVTGRIVEMPVYPGDSVRPGQIVARLDDVELGSRVREAAAGANAAEANVAQMEADIIAARHGVAQMERELAMVAAEVGAARDGVTQMEKELAMAEAEAGYQEQVIVREERLFRSGAVSRQDVENARAMVASARAKVEAARAKREQAKAMTVAAEAKREAARARQEQARAMESSALRKRDAMAAMAVQGQAMLKTAEVVRDYVNIRAPSAGYVVKRLVAPGVLVQPGMAIFKIAQIDRVRLQANVGEKDLAGIKVGSPVTVTTTTPGQPPISARVTSVFPFVDQGPRTAVVEAIVENSSRRLLSGQYVMMQFTIGERADALTVPGGAVARLGGQSTVWVVRDGRAEPRVVTTGLESPDRIEITRGLTPAEQVVARGHQGLYAGARVIEAAGGGTAARPQSEPHKGMPGMSGSSPATPEKSGESKEGARGRH